MLPTREKIARNRWLARFGTWMLHPALWRLSRRTVAGGVAAGMLCGLIPGPFQMLGGALLSLWMRWNAPVAMVVTFYTNPFTIIPIYILACRIGLALLPRGEMPPLAALTPPRFEWLQFGHSLAALGHWAVSLGWPLVVGLVALGIMLAIAGWLIVWFGWSWTILGLRRHRNVRRETRLRSQSAAQSRS